MWVLARVKRGFEQYILKAIHFLCYASCVVAIFLFFFGAAIGSFLTVLIDRLPKGISVIKGRSFCEHCKHTLSWLDLFPIFSYLILRGRCRYCKAKIGSHYLFLEILVGLLFVLVFFATIGHVAIVDQISLETALLLLYRLIVIACLFVIFFIDLKERIIPFSMVVIIAVVSVLWLVFSQPAFLGNHILAALGASAFFLTIYLVTKGKGMGFGDVLLSISIGLVLGFPTTLVALYIAFLTGSVISLILILTRKKTLKSAIPFGPFLVLGTGVCLLWGEQLTRLFLLLLRLPA